MADGTSHALPFDQELVVDLFAGGGGASTGIARAYREPDVAVNHDAIAIAVHRANHPNTEHHQADVFEVDPIAATRGRPVGLLWASPDCRHHSKAKGTAPRSKRIRGLAWVVVRWALATMPRVIEIENVEEFKDWGPLDATGHAIKARRGETFRAFVAAMTTGLAADHPAMAEIAEFLGPDAPVAALVRGLRYSFDSREIRACDKGAPTIRKRLVIKFRRDGKPITWSPDTHGKPGSPDVMAGRLLPYRTAADCIDWSLPACSIFADKDEARAFARANGMRGTPVRPLAAATNRRIAKGLWRHVLAAENPYIVGTQDEAARDSTELPQPLAGQRLARRVRARDEAVRSAGLGDDTGRPAASAGSLSQPRPFRSGDGATLAARAVSSAPILTEFANASSQRTFAVAEPLRTQVAQVKGGHFAIAAATMIQTGYGERDGQAPRVLDLRKPLGTAVAGGVKHAVAAAHIVKFCHDSIGSAIDEPLHTVTAGGNMARPAGAAHAMGIATAFLEQANGGFFDGTGRDLREPTSTILQSGSHQQLVSAYLVKFYKSGGQWSDCGAPMHTVPTKDRMGLVQVINMPADILAPELRARARQVAQFLHEHLPEHFPEPADMVLVGDRVMVDITLRMLVPRELARAQGFPDSYILDRGLFETEPGSGKFEWRPITKTDQVRLVGNSVCPDMAEAEASNDLCDLVALYGAAA